MATPASGSQEPLRRIGSVSYTHLDVYKRQNWNWSNDTRKEPRFAILTVDKAQAEGTVITLDGLTSLMDNNQDMFQVTQGKVREGLPMLRAEVRLIGKEGLTGAERDAQLAAFRELILDTNRQNFFIKVNGGKEIHMRGYAPTSAYKAEYEALVAGCLLYTSSTSTSRCLALTLL